jgi:hypothetical protein
MSQPVAVTWSFGPGIRRVDVRFDFFLIEMCPLPSAVRPRQLLGHPRHSRHVPYRRIQQHINYVLCPRNSVHLCEIWWHAAAERALRVMGPKIRSLIGMSEKSLVLESTVTCPVCGHRETEIMPTDACQFFYDCKGCAAVLKPKAGDCCVFCSYGDTPCPPIQESGKSCCSH